MKKAHFYNFILILVAYIIPFLINKYYDYNFFAENNAIKYVISISLFLFVLLTSTFYLVKQLFDLFIKHDKKVKLSTPRLLVFILVLLTTFTFIYTNLEYYYYFGSMILLYIFYFIFLIFLDNKYIKISEENKIKINDELVNDFLILLGGKENIVSVSYEYSRLKVEVKNIKIVNLEKVKALGAQGLFVAGNKLQAIVGNNASDLENAIKRYLTIV